MFIVNLLGDKLVGEVSRLVVAEACIQALDIESTEGQIYEINSVKVFIFFDRVQLVIDDYFQRQISENSCDSIAQVKIQSY